MNNRIRNKQLERAYISKRNDAQIIIRRNCYKGSSQKGIKGEEVARTGILVQECPCLVRTIKTADGMVLEVLNISNSKVSTVNLTKEQQQESEESEYNSRITRKILSESSFVV